MRALLELLFTIGFIVVARIVLRNLLMGVGQAVANNKTQGETAAGQTARDEQGVPLQGVTLEKDPVCGTYVANTVRFQRQVGERKFFYCSAECQEKHTLVAR